MEITVQNCASLYGEINQTMFEGGIIMNRKDLHATIIAVTFILVFCLAFLQDYIRLLWHYLLEGSMTQVLLMSSAV